MNTLNDLRAELHRQADDRPNPAALGPAAIRIRRLRRSRVGAAALAAAAVVLLAVGAAVIRPGSDTITPATTGNTPGESTLELDCRNNIGVDPAPDQSLTVVLGVVAINTDRQEPEPETQQTGPGFPFDPAQQYFSKSGLQVRTRAPFRLEVSPAQRGRVKLGWNNTSFTPADAEIVPSCPTEPSTSADRWFSYPGGIWVSAPTCVELQVVTSGASSMVRIPVGKDCG